MKKLILPILIFITGGIILFSTVKNVDYELFQTINEVMPFTSRPISFLKELVNSWNIDVIVTVRNKCYLIIFLTVILAVGSYFITGLILKTREELDKKRAKKEVKEQIIGEIIKDDNME